MLELCNISKSFPGVKALDGVSVSFSPGEIHALLGENGAGKSTLMKIICGIYRPDSGEILLNGKRLELKSFKDAIDNEISIVNQEIQMIPDFSIGENILLDKLDQVGRRYTVSWKKLHEKAQYYLKMVELPLDSTRKVGKLSTAQKQLIQIAKALSSNAKVLLLDEPTSSLTQRDVEHFYSVVRNLKEMGVTIIFVTHKIEEVMELCDRTTVLRDGKHIGTRLNKDLDKQSIIEMMIGRKTQTVQLGTLNIDPDNRVLDVHELSQGKRFKNISFHLCKGEILGFYGLLGSGRTELAKIIIGEAKYDSGEVYVNGKKARIRSVAECVEKYKIGYVSENRKEEGLILKFSVKTNLMLPAIRLLRNFFRKISNKEEIKWTQQLIDMFDIRTPHIDKDVLELSGGNQQKISLGKWLAIDCDIIIIDEPTVGIDVGAKDAIHRIIWDLAEKEKKSIILISSDMPELCLLSRRILVFKDFTISKEIDGINDRQYTYEELSPVIGAYL